MEKKTVEAMVAQIATHDNFGQLRYIKKGEEFWFVAADVCGILELTNPTVAVERLDEDEKAKFNLGLLSNIFRGGFYYGEKNC